MLSYIKSTAHRVAYETTVTAVVLHVLAEHVVSETRLAYGWIRFLMVRP